MTGQPRALMGYEFRAADLFRECLRDAELGDLTTTLANLGALSMEEFVDLLAVAEKVLDPTSRA